MKAIEVTGTIDETGQLLLDRPLAAETPGRVRIIVLFQEPAEETEGEIENDPDDTPVEEIKASLRRALQQAKAGKRIPLSQMCEGIDVELIPFCANRFNPRVQTKFAGLIQKISPNSGGYSIRNLSNTGW